jgi:Na+-transporting NADH:ubiquinone oxidoreductase subunit NqrB
VLAAVVAVSSKFVLRVRGKHILNPTNGALVILLALQAPIWVSSGQWGDLVWFAFAITCAGGIVVHRALRSDVTFAFLVSWCAVLFGRAAWLGQPVTVPLHQLSSGALLLYSFFMISDPRTTPDSRIGRVLFALLVALGAGFVQFVLFRPNGLLWSLAAFSLAVPLIDRVLPGTRYQWNRVAARPGTLATGEQHETLPAPIRA